MNPQQRAGEILGRRVDELSAEEAQWLDRREVVLTPVRARRAWRALADAWYRLSFRMQLGPVNGCGSEDRDRGYRWI